MISGGGRWQKINKPCTWQYVILYGHMIYFSNLISLHCRFNMSKKDPTHIWPDEVSSWDYTHSQEYTKTSSEWHLPIIILFRQNEIQDSLCTTWWWEYNLLILWLVIFPWWQLEHPTKTMESRILSCCRKPYKHHYTVILHNGQHMDSHR